MPTSLIYKSSLSYKLLMRLKYGSSYSKRYEGLARHIFRGESVLELCPGDFTLYSQHLKAKPLSRYVAIESSEVYVNRGRKLGLEVVHRDLNNLEAWPQTEVVVMQGSLYQFYPCIQEILLKFATLSCKRILISEDVQSWGKSNSPFKRTCARWLTRTDRGNCAFRFSADGFKETLQSSFAQYGDWSLCFEELCSGREILGIVERIGC